MSSTQRRPATTGTVGHLGAYGKLPISREFLWASVERGLGRRVRELIDGAAPLISGGSEAFELRARLAGSDRREHGIATLWPSSDAGGMRPYPFCFFSIFERQAGCVGPGAFAAGAGVHAQHAELREQALDRIDGAAGFEALVSGAEVRSVLADEDPNEVPSLAARDLTRSLGGRGEPAARTLWRLRAAARADERESAGVLLPLGASATPETASDFWLAVLRSCQGYARAELEAAIALGARPSLSLLRRPLAAADLGAVIGRPAPDVTDLTSTARPRDLDGFARFAQRVDELLDGDRIAAEDVSALLAFDPD